MQKRNNECVTGEKSVVEYRGRFGWGYPVLWFDSITYICFLEKNDILNKIYNKNKLLKLKLIIYKKKRRIISMLQCLYIEMNENDQIKNLTG